MNICVCGPITIIKETRLKNNGLKDYVTYLLLKLSCERRCYSGLSAELDEQEVDFIAGGVDNIQDVEEHSQPGSH